MKSFSNYLAEKRKNPDQNPKISAYDALKPYKDNPNIYITFTGVDKVGINPHSGFNTPNGIYTYPLKEIWKGFNHKNGWVDVPFAGESPFVWVLEKTGKVFQTISEYGSSDYDADMRKLKKLYADKKILTKMKTLVDKGFNKNWNQVKKLDSKLKYIFKLKKAPTQMEIGKFDDHFEWDNDFMTTLVNAHKEDPEDSVLQELVDDNPEIDINRIVADVMDGGIGMPKLKIRVLKMEVEKYMNGRLKDLAEAGLSPIDIIIQNATDSARQKSPFGAFWNVTRWVAYEGNPEGTGIAYGLDMAKYKQMKLPSFEKVEPVAGQKLSKDKQYWHTDWTVSVNLTAQKWNNLLRKLGYIGFADKEATGSIHPSEPMQAIFLAKNGFKILDKFRNINPKKMYRTIAEFKKSNYGLDELAYDAKSGMLVFDNYMFNSGDLPMVNIPVKGIKWSANDIKEISRGFNDMEFSGNKANKYMLDIFYNNIWMLPERDFRHLLHHIALDRNYRDAEGGKLKAVKYILLQLNKRKGTGITKSTKYINDWLQNIPKETK